jgi:hypothetical protein
MKEEEFKRMFPDLYKIWETWNAEYNYPSKDEIINLMIDVKNAIIEDMNSRFKETLIPTFLISKLHEFGFKGTLIKEDSLYNSNVSDKPIGKYTEALKLD